MFNNAYQNLELKIDLASGGTTAGLKEKIKSVLGNKILILCGLKLSGVDKLPAVCEPKIYVTQTEEPDDWDEEEDGEFVPEDVYHLEASNIYGYDIAIEDDVISTTKATPASVEAIEAGTIDNTKPIYCHPISIDSETATAKFHVAILIFDNSDEEYNSYAKLVAKLESILSANPLAIFPATGAVYYESLSALHIAQKFGYYQNALNLYTCRPDGTQGNFNVSNYLTEATIYDGVNKIN